MSGIRKHLDRMFGRLSERERRIVEAAKDPWKNAVLDQCVIHHMSWDEQDPQGTLHKLMCMSNQIALDPLVSADAQALVDRGRADAKADIKSALELLIHRRLDR